MQFDAFSNTYNLITLLQSFRDSKVFSQQYACLLLNVLIVSHQACPCVSFPVLKRKHCEINHREINNKKKDTKGSEGRKSPCRYFQNGEGQCLPRSGVSPYDHNVISNTVIPGK